jgi:hypothetical protein
MNNSGGTSLKTVMREPAVDSVDNFSEVYAASIFMTLKCKINELL